VVCDLACGMLHARTDTCIRMHVWTQAFIFFKKSITLFYFIVILIVVETQERMCVKCIFFHKILLIVAGGDTRKDLHHAQKGSAAWHLLGRTAATILL